MRKNLSTKSSSFGLLSTSSSPSYRRVSDSGEEEIIVVVVDRDDEEQQGTTTMSEPNDVFGVPVRGEPDKNDELVALANHHNSVRTENEDTPTSVTLNHEQPERESGGTATRWAMWLRTPLLPDSYGGCGSCSTGNEQQQHHQNQQQLYERMFVIKLLKFIVGTWLWILLIFIWVRLFPHRLEFKASLTLADLVTYQSVDIVQDTFVFFVVGRLYRLPGMDHAESFLTILFCQVYFCTLEQMSFLKHSVTLYDIHCRWPLSLWLFVLLLVPLVITLFLKHVHYAVQHEQFGQKFLEVTLCVVFFLVPYLPSKYLHLHHWFAGWLIGMHCNISDRWWSRVALAWAWGVYINGIAVYGRDPVLTCGASYYWSNNLHCPYLDCYQQGLLDAAAAQRNHTNHHDKPPVKPMIPPNWRNCSADSYHP